MDGKPRMNAKQRAAERQANRRFKRNIEVFWNRVHKQGGMLALCALLPGKKAVRIDCDGFLANLPNWQAATQMQIDAA